MASSGYDTNSIYFGISCSVQALTFGIVNDTMPRNELGLAFGFNNMVICFGNAVFQMLDGYIIDHLWNHKTEIIDVSLD